MLTALWEFSLPAGSEPGPGRNEEALFLHHLRRSPHWDNVVEAVGHHRGRQASFDAQDAIARRLSRGIFRMTLEAPLWKRLTMTAGVEEEYATPPWEMRSGYCFVKGTKERYDPDARGPQTKYAALFDARAVFDGLRVSYLRLTCGPGLVRLQDALNEYLSSDEPSDNEGTAAVLNFLDECGEHFVPASELHCPPWLEDAVWPCFVDSICDERRLYATKHNHLELHKIIRIHVRVPTHSARPSCTRVRRPLCKRRAKPSSIDARCF